MRVESGDDYRIGCNTLHCKIPLDAFLHSGKSFWVRSGLRRYGYIRFYSQPNRSPNEFLNFFPLIGTTTLYHRHCFYFHRKFQESFLVREFVRPAVITIPITVACVFPSGTSHRTLLTTNDQRHRQYFFFTVLLFIIVNS